jgi:antitoxin VapB
MSQKRSKRVAEPSAAYSAKPRLTRAKLFPNGRSQAVRLPKEFRLPGSEVLIHREGDRLIIEAIDEGPVDRNGWPINLWHDIDALLSGIDIPEIPPMPARFLTPEEIDPDVDWKK